MVNKEKPNVTGEEIKRIKTYKLFNNHKQGMEYNSPQEHIVE